MRFAVFVSAASASSLTPVEQVINMMAGLQKKIEEEGKNEATLYEKFACFCKDKTDEKSTDITEGAARVGELTGELSQLESDRNTTNTNIAQNEADIKSETETLDTENEEWDATVKVYERDITDLQEGKRQIDDALAFLKRARDDIKGEAFLQKFQAAVAVADAVGFNTKKAQSVVTMVQSGNFHSDHIIEIVEELDQDFVDSIEAHQKEHLQAKHTHQDVEQTQKGLLDALQVTLTDNKKQLASLNENIAETMKELTLTQANLYDDQNYLKDLTDKCEAKAKAWDQRASMRASELGTISEAIAIVKGTVAEKADATSQSGHGQRVLLLADREDETEATEKKVPEHRNTMKLALAEMHKRSAALLQQAQKQKHADGAGSQTPTDFLQMSMVTRRLRGVEDETRQRLMSLFSEKAAKLKSQVLAEVAMHVAGDPFAKIKTLIQNMIERLLEEAGGDAEHEGWCNTELKKTKQKRDYQEENVEADTQTIHKLEGRRDTLEEQEEQLTKEIGELNDALSQANATRVQEHEDNEEAVDSATEGNTAVEKAIDILTKFYKKAAKAKVELVQQSPDEDAPDTGFDGAYKGGQEENGGILGMLEVISSDFERTIKETTKAENEAQRQFTEFKRQSLSSLAKKNAALEQTQTDLSETNQELADTVEDLEEQQTGLNNAVVEWEKLRPACVELGATSYEDRKAAREDEIESLKQALCILADPAGAANC